MSLRVAILFNDDRGRALPGEAKDRIAIEGAAAEAEALAGAVARCGYVAIPVGAVGDAAALVQALVNARPDVVLNVCEGFGGDSKKEGAVAGLLELLGLPYTGNPPGALLLAQDKARTKALLRGAGAPVAAGFTLSRVDGEIPADARFPLFVKTRFEDASHGISHENVCPDEASLRRRAAALFAAWRQDLVVETYLPGRELNVALLEEETSTGPTSPVDTDRPVGRSIGPDVLPISEIDFSKLPPGRPPVVTYDAKWVEGSPDYQGTPVLCPAMIDEALRTEVSRVARLAWDAVGCRGYARVDVRLDAQGAPVILEVNPNPDISPDAGLARSARCAGIEYEGLIDRIIRNALRRVTR